MTSIFKMLRTISSAAMGRGCRDIERTSAPARARRVEIMMGKLYEMELNIQELVTTFTKL